MKANKREIQRRIAYETARILTEQRSGDPLHALHKAASQLGVQDRRLLPSRDEVEQALREQQRLFRGPAQQSALTTLRRAALQAMQALHRFHPLLVGAVYRGTADSNSRVELQLFAEPPEEVVFTLSDLRIPWQSWDHDMYFSQGVRRRIPGFRFVADGVRFGLVVLPPSGRFRRPLDRADNRPIQGASITQLEQLLRSTADGGHPPGAPSRD